MYEEVPLQGQITGQSSWEACWDNARLDNDETLTGPSVQPPNPLPSDIRPADEIPPQDAFNLYVIAPNSHNSSPFAHPFWQADYPLGDNYQDTSNSLDASTPNSTNNLTFSQHAHNQYSLNTYEQIPNPHPFSPFNAHFSSPNSLYPERFSGISNHSPQDSSLFGNGSHISHSTGSINDFQIQAPTDNQRSTVSDISAPLVGSNSERSSLPGEASGLILGTNPAHFGSSGSGLHSERASVKSNPKRDKTGRSVRGSRAKISRSNDNTQELVGETAIVKKQNKRSPFSLPERRETSITRKIAACIHCRRQRVRCIRKSDDPTVPCVACTSARSSAQAMTRLPCLRYKISDMQVYTKGDHPQLRWSQRWKTWDIIEVNRWASPDIKTITLTQDVNGLDWNLQVRKVILKEGDKSSRGWVTNGQQMWHECAPYAIEDMEVTGKLLNQFVDNSIEATIQYYVGEADELVWKTYNMALRHSGQAKNDKERRLLRLVLSLWVAIRLLTRSSRIRGEGGGETLGTRPQDYDTKSKNYTHILVPPIVSAQLELIIMVKILDPLRKKVLCELQELMKKAKIESWFTMYLCTFIFLHSCARVTKYENEHARKFALPTRYRNASLLRKIHRGCDIILANFIYGNKGGLPFRLDWSSPSNIGLADLNDEQVEFVKHSAQLIKGKELLFKEIKDKGLFEDDLYFVSQMYDDEWKPVPTI